MAAPKAADERTSAIDSLLGTKGQVTYFTHPNLLAKLLVRAKGLESKALTYDWFGDVIMQWRIEQDQLLPDERAFDAYLREFGKGGFWKEVEVRHHGPPPAPTPTPVQPKPTAKGPSPSPTPVQPKPTAKGPSPSLTPGLPQPAPATQTQPQPQPQPPPAPPQERPDIGEGALVLAKLDRPPSIERGMPSGPPAIPPKMSWLLIQTFRKQGIDGLRAMEGLRSLFTSQDWPRDLLEVAPSITDVRDRPANDGWTERSMIAIAAAYGTDTTLGKHTAAVASTHAAAEFSQESARIVAGSLTLLAVSFSKILAAANVLSKEKTRLAAKPPIASDDPMRPYAVIVEATDAIDVGMYLIPNLDLVMRAGVRIPTITWPTIRKHYTEKKLEADAYRVWSGFLMEGADKYIKLETAIQKSQNLSTRQGVNAAHVGRAFSGIAKAYLNACRLISFFNSWMAEERNVPGLPALVDQQMDTDAMEAGSARGAFDWGLSDEEDDSDASGPPVVAATAAAPAPRPAPAPARGGRGAGGFDWTSDGDDDAAR